MHAEFDCLNDIGETSLSTEFCQNPGQKLFAGGPIEFDFDEGITFFKFADQGIGLAEVHGRVVDHFSFPFGRIDQAITYGSGCWHAKERRIDPEGQISFSKHVQCVY